ncbi:MAG TPA: Rv2231c family pyridoxal phosphate-dependent protein CobC [Solirubrobacteraceae bacterium]|nr:Rv2231c family pyridoxal phosphate-dependent protein CobC [Solirubrobacteraceae bacterium]
MSDPLRTHGDAFVGPGVLDFAVNVWPTPPSPALRATLERALADSAPYPDERPAREAVARRHGRPPGEVLVLNGACEAFWLIAHALRPRHAVCVHPAFTEPEAALRATGAPVTRVQRPSGDWRLIPDDVPPEADLVVLGNPNNPTGNLDPADTIAALAAPHRVLVVDESFLELTEHPHQSLAGRGELPGLVVVRSLTKLWGLAGLRAGYLLAPTELVAALEAQRQPWSVNAAALAALEYCAMDTATPPGVARDVASARADLLARLGALGHVFAWPATANFVLLAVPNGEATVDRLAAQSIAVRRASTFPGLTGDHLRVAVRCPADHQRLVGAL